MKLVRAPVGKYEEVAIREVSLVPTRYEWAFVPFYRKPVEFEERTIRTSWFAGRKTYSDCEIDFEDEHDDAVRLHTMMLEAILETGSSLVRWKRDIDIDGFALKGVFTLENMGGTVWRCSIDCFEKR